MLYEVITGGTILYLLRGRYSLAQDTLLIHYGLVTLYYLQALLISAALRYVQRFRRLVHIQIVWDLLFSSTLIYVTGGIESYFSFLFLFVITSYSIHYTKLYEVASVAPFGLFVELDEIYVEA